MKNKYDKKSRQMRMDPILSGLLIFGSIVVAAVFAVVSSDRPLTNLEAVLLQSFGLGAGLIGSFIFGRQSTQKAAVELVKPHARSAFRRLWSLYQSLSRLAEVVQSAQRARFDNENSEKQISNNECIAVIEAIISEQLSTADDALEDWRDLIPEDIEVLEQRMNTRQNNKNRMKGNE